MIGPSRNIFFSTIVYTNILKGHYIVGFLNQFSYKVSPPHDHWKMLQGVFEDFSYLQITNSSYHCIFSSPQIFCRCMINVDNTSLERLHHMG